MADGLGIINHREIAIVIDRLHEKTFFVKKLVGVFQNIPENEKIIIKELYFGVSIILCIGIHHSLRIIIFIY